MKKLSFIALSVWLHLLAIGNNQTQASYSSSAFGLYDDYYESLEFELTESYDLTCKYFYCFDSSDLDSMNFESEEDKEEYLHEVAEDENTPNKTFILSTFHDSVTNLDMISIYKISGHWAQPVMDSICCVLENDKKVWIHAYVEKRDIMDYEVKDTSEYELIEHYCYYDAQENPLRCRERRVKGFLSQEDSLKKVFTKLPICESNCKDDDVREILWIVDSTLSELENLKKEKR